jgi:hypothetical protein
VVSVSSWLRTGRVGIAAEIENVTTADLMEWAERAVKGDELEDVKALIALSSRFADARKALCLVAGVDAVVEQILNGGSLSFEVSRIAPPGTLSVSECCMNRTSFLSRCFFVRKPVSQRSRARSVVYNMIQLLFAGILLVIWGFS